MVAKVIKSATAETWAGTTVTSPDNSGFSSAIPFTTTETFMSVRVWSPNAGIPIRLKVEDHADVTHTVETEVVSTVAGAWETLVFNFANEAPGTAELNLNYTFDKASFFSISEQVVLQQAKKFTTLMIWPLVVAQPAKITM